MTTWIDRFTKMQPLDVLMTINEDVSTLIAFLNEVRDLRNPPGDERDMSAMQAARAVVDEAADEVLTLRAKLRNCEDQYKASANSRRLTNELQQNERIRELRAELESALDRNSALRDNEQILFRQLSDALTGGNASTWDEVLHAATVRAESTADLREAAGALDGFADRAVNPDAVPRLRELAQACRRAVLTAPPAAPEGETYPLTLNDAQQREVKAWAADDRLWTTQETVEINLRTFARKMLALATPPAPPAPELVELVRTIQESDAAIEKAGMEGDMHAVSVASTEYDDAIERLLAYPLPSGPPAPVAESPMVNRYTCAHGVYFRMDCPDCEARRPNQPVEVEASTEEAKASATASAGRRDAMRALEIVPCVLAEANAFVAEHHRHHRPVVGAKFCLSVARGDDVVGVAIVGRPVARHMDDGLTLEVTRVATDGTPNACSALYGAARRATFALGYRKLITYTLASEGGASLRASGWRVVGEVKGRSWSRSSRPRVDKHPTEDKLRWEAPTPGAQP